MFSKQGKNIIYLIHFQGLRSLFEIPYKPEFIPNMV